MRMYIDSTDFPSRTQPPELLPGGSNDMEDLKETRWLREYDSDHLTLVQNCELPRRCFLMATMINRPLLSAKPSTNWVSAILGRRSSSLFYVSLRILRAGIYIVSRLVAFALQKQ
jgi:hypothetical protein